MPIVETIRALPITGLVEELVEQYPDHVERARVFYRKQMEQAFAVSTAILKRGAIHRGRNAMDALDVKNVEPFLAEVEIGQYESARSIGEQAVARMWTLDPSGALSPREWWRNLLDYEFALFLQLSTDPKTRTVLRPLRGASATLRTYMWDIRTTMQLAAHADSGTSGVTALSRVGFDVDTFAPAIPGERSHRLLFSRDASNQVNIASVTAPEATLFREINGKRTIAELAQETGQNEKAVRMTLNDFATSGAVLIPEH